MQIDEKLFAEARFRVLGEDYYKDGIGTLSERALHRILKLYLEPDENFHEVKFEGSIVDIKNSRGVIEVQTRALKKLIPKLKKLLPICHVEVVYPMYSTKHITVIDKKSGELSRRRKSPKSMTRYDCFFELYNLREFIGNENFSVKLMMLDVDEYRYVHEMVDGKYYDKLRVECIPNRIEEIIELNTARDYAVFLPEGLPEEFCSADLSHAISKNFRYSYSGMRILESAGLIEKIGRSGRRIMYKKVKEYDV